MALSGDDRLADDMGEIGADREIPVHPDRAQGWPGNEAAADAEKTTHHSD